MQVICFSPLNVSIAIGLTAWQRVAAQLFKYLFI